MAWSWQYAMSVCLSCTLEQIVSMRILPGHCGPYCELPHTHGHPDLEMT